MSPGERDTTIRLRIGNSAWRHHQITLSRPSESDVVQLRVDRGDWWQQDLQDQHEDGFDSSEGELYFELSREQAKSLAQALVSVSTEPGRGA